MPGSPIVATWKLLSFTMTTDDGQITHPYGENPSGYYLFNADGHCAAILGRPDRPRLGTTDLSAGIEEQKAAAAQDFTAYAGRYEYLGEKLVTHVEVSLFPDWIGGDQEREADLKGNRLILGARTTRNGVPGKARLVWERVGTS